MPFLGRQGLLDQLTRWCHDAAGKPIKLITGGGGSGKTRLAREACVQMLVNGWDAGMADDQRQDGTAMNRLQRPTLLVVDDADLRTGLIVALVEYLRWDDAGPPVNLLLLARAAGPWWDRLIRQQDLTGACTVLDLDRHPVPPTSRAEHFARASTAFAGAYSGPAAHPASPPPAAARLDDPAYAEPLLIHIAALLRTLGTSPAPPPTSPREAIPDEDMPADHTGRLVRQRLLRALCERERIRWYQLGERLPFNPDLPLADQVVALATLTAVGDEASATHLLVAVPSHAEVTRIGADALTMWARRLYTGPGYWNPMRPDLLAEQHLADTAQLSALASAAAQAAAGYDWEMGLFTQLLAELTRGAPNQPALQATLSELLAATLPRIIHLTVTAGHAELADMATLALQLAPQPGVAATLADQMPEHSVQLAALAALLTSQQVIHERASLDAGPDAASRLARSLNNLSVRLAGLGRREEALAAIEEATGLYRELARARPDAFAPDLARSLNNLSVQLADLGRREEALAAIEEAVTLRRELARARPDAFGPNLPGSLNNLSLRLAGLGRREEALAAIEEATGLYRELARARPDAFAPDLARSLNNLSLRLAGLGRREEALAASEEATGLYRELARARPDAFGPDLAMSLNNLSLRLAGLGRREEALAAIEEATGLYRELARARPDAFGPDLAMSLNNLSLRLAGLGRREEALAASEEATGLYRELARGRPDAFGPDLAASLNNLSLQLADLGRREEALAASEEATGLYRELARARPDAFGPGLAASLNNLSVRLGDLGRREEALAAIEEATGLYRELARARRDAFGPDLAASLNNLSADLAGLGRREEALAASEETVTLRRELARARPDAFGSDLARSLNNLSVQLADLGRREEALAASEEATGLYRELARARPDAFGSDLARSLNNLSADLADLGRREEALAAIEEATGLYWELAARWPHAYRHDLEQSLRVAEWLKQSEDGGTSPHE